VVETSKRPPKAGVVETFEWPPDPGVVETFKRPPDPGVVETFKGPSGLAVVGAATAEVTEEQWPNMSADMKNFATPVTKFKQFNFFVPPTDALKPPSTAASNRIDLNDANAYYEDPRLFGPPGVVETSKWPPDPGVVEIFKWPPDPGVVETLKWPPDLDEVGTFVWATNPGCCLGA